MNWFKNANKNIVSRIKSILKKHPFCYQLLDYYNIPITDIDDHLIIEIIDLKGGFAAGNGKKIFLDKKLFNNEFFKENFHFVIHEFFHWIKRRFENNFYFNDPEEVQSFVLAITWELINGKNKEQIKKSIYPIIKEHYKNKKNLNEDFEGMFKKALELCIIYKNRIRDF